VPSPEGREEAILLFASQKCLTCLQLLKQFIGDGSEFVVAKVEHSKWLLGGFITPRDGDLFDQCLFKSSIFNLIKPNTSEGKPLMKFFARPKLSVVYARERKNRYKRALPLIISKQ